MAYRTMKTILIIFPKLYQPDKSQPKIDKTFLVFSPVAVGLFLMGLMLQHQ